jgi:hypothetical protein
MPLPAKAPAATPAEVVAKNWSVTFSSEVRYFSWTSDRSYPPGAADPTFRGKGSQIYVPVALQLVGLPNPNIKIEILGRGGWVKSKQTSTDRSGEISTILDSQLSATATYLGIDGIQPFASINFNFPTGKTILTASEANARMDSDLVDVAGFGEGFNVGPTLGLNLALTSNAIVILSAGYTQRGAFMRDGSSNPLIFPPAETSELDPGDVFTATATFGFQIGQLGGNFTGSLSTETDTKAGEQPIFKAGKRYMVSGTLAYAWPETWGATTLSASWSHAEKNKLLFVVLAPYFDTEPFNSNSNIYRVGLEHLFPFGQLWVGPAGSYLYRDHNGYDSQTLQFVPAKTRWSAGLLARYAVSDNATFNARVEHVWIHESDAYPASPFSVLTDSFQPIPGLPAISSAGWQGALGANVTF